MKEVLVALDFNAMQAAWWFNEVTNLMVWPTDIDGCPIANGIFKDHLEGAGLAKWIIMI